MPATTRSKTLRGQTRLEDFESKPAKEGKVGNSKPKGSTAPKTKQNSNTGSKRKRIGNQKNTPAATAPTKKQKQALIKSDEDVTPSEDSRPVIINRAPVLQLWAACIAQKLLSTLPWDTHLSIGSAISALCAVSKGRAIGKIDQPSDDSDKKAEKGRKKQAAEESADDEVNIMGFKLLLQDGNAVVSGKPHKANEGLLKKKYGDGDFDRVKETIEEAIAVFERQSKQGDLSRTAFR